MTKYNEPAQTFGKAEVIGVKGRYVIRVDDEYFRFPPKEHKYAKDIAKAYKWVEEQT